MTIDGAVPTKTDAEAEAELTAEASRRSEIDQQRADDVRREQEFNQRRDEQRNAEMRVFACVELTALNGYLHRTNGLPGNPLRERANARADELLKKILA